MAPLSTVFRPHRDAVIKLRNQFEDSNYLGFAGILEMLYLQESEEILQVSQITLWGVKARHQGLVLDLPNWCLQRESTEREDQNTYQSFSLVWEYRWYLGPWVIHLVDAVLLEVVLYYRNPRPFHLFAGIEIT